MSVAVAPEAALSREQIPQVRGHLQMVTQRELGQARFGCANGIKGNPG